MARVPVQDAERMIGSGSIGVPVPEVDVRLSDADGNEVPVGEPGEMVVRSLVMFSGYLNQPEETARALQDGWYRTGDLVRRDEHGFLYFVGRTKDMVRRSGENVAAAEIEEVLRAHQKVLDAAVIPKPDDLRGEEIVAHVQLRDGEAPDGATAADLIAHCGARLAAFKVPRFIAYRLTPFPRTPSMRVQKKELDVVPTASTLFWDRERGAFLTSDSTPADEVSAS